MFKTALSIPRGIPNAFAARCLGPLYFSRAKTDAVSTKAEPVKITPALLAEKKALVLEKLKEELPKPYEGAERDYVNFPRRVRPIEAPPVRFGFLPDEWFTFFYKKTGVTGPYLFGTGLITFLLSKEWYVIEHELSTGVALFILAYTAMKKGGPAFRKLMDGWIKEDEDKFENMKRGNMEQLERSISEQNKNIWEAEGQRILMEAKRENVQMQLEIEYRKRMMHVYEQVKKRLDYQLDLYNTRRKLEQKHMVDWVVNNVVKSITPQQEKEALQKCIEDLKVLSTSAR